MVCPSEELSLAFSCFTPNDNLQPTCPAGFVLVLHASLYPRITDYYLASPTFCPFTSGRRTFTPARVLSLE